MLNKTKKTKHFVPIAPFHYYEIHKITKHERRSPCDGNLDARVMKFNGIHFPILSVNRTATN